MKKRILCSVVLTALSTMVAADDSQDPLLSNDLLLDDIGITLDSSELELDLFEIDPIMPEASPAEPTAPEVDPLFDPLLDFDPLSEPVVEPVIAPVEPVVPIAEPTPAPVETPVQVAEINVDEVFYSLVLDPSTNRYSRTPTTQAKPGDLIELVITATNNSNTTITNAELVNSVPTGPIDLLVDSFDTDLARSLYRYSTNGTSFFPTDSTIDPDKIRYIQWFIFSLEPNESLEFSYRLQIRQ